MDSMPRNKFKKNSEPVDDWLAKEGYFRKMAPKDSTCLFRVVSEQIYLSQLDHIRVRKECVNYMQRYTDIIEKNVTISVKDYLDQMSCLTQWGGENEIRAMSLLYKVDFVVFNALKFTKTIVTNNEFEKKIYLCHTPPRQYDAVYTQEYISNAAFCQSIVYQSLYKSVFKMDDIDNTVHKMLHERSPEYRHDKYFLKGNVEFREQLKLELYNKLEHKLEDCEENEENRGGNFGSAPFPYRVAKALDPHIFRNTDLDIWFELKREVKNSGWIRFNNDFQIGAKCLVQKTVLDKKNENLDKENNNLYPSETEDPNDDLKLSKVTKKDELFYNGHIQEMSKNEGPVVVYIEELGERKTVPYSALKPMNARKTKQNPNWSSVPKKNINPDQNTKWKKNWSCSRRTKEHGSSLNMPNFDRNNGPVSRKDGNETKDWNDNNHKAGNLKVPDKFKMQSFNASPNYLEAAISTTPLENGQQFAVPDNNSHKIPDEDNKKHVQSDINRNNVNMKNQNIGSNGNSGNNMYQMSPQYNTQENLSPITPTYQPINLSVSKSVDINGSDLPFSEPCTLRFFYNLGLEYFHTNQMWNYPTNNQMIAPAYYTSQNPPPMTGTGNPPMISSNGINTTNEEPDQMSDMNRSKMQSNIRHKDDNMDRNRNNMQKNPVSRNNERYNKPPQNVQTYGIDSQKNSRDFNKSTPHSNSERKDQNMNKDVQKNNRNCLGPRFRKNEGRNSHMLPMHLQKDPNQNKYGNGNNKNNEQSQQCDVETAPPAQQQSFNAAPIYPVQFNQPQMYSQVAVCSSEADAYGGFYPQPNFYPVVYPPPQVANGEPSSVGMDDTGYQMYPQGYMYHQTPIYSISGVPDNWYPVAGPHTAFMPYGQIVSPNAPNTPNNTQNAPTV